MKKIILPALTLLLIASCQKNEVGVDTSGSVVQFGAAEITSTRVADDMWELYDMIGIYAYDENSEEGEYISSNFMYHTETESTSSALFYATSDAITYSPGVTNYFFAYYPYSPLAQGEYSVDVSSQSSLSDIDFMVSNIEEGSEEDNEVVKLEFSHQLSYVEVAIDISTINSSANDLESVAVNGVATKGSFDFSEMKLTADNAVGTIDMSVEIEDNTITAKAILLPTTTGFGLEFKFADETFTATVTDELESGYRYYYTTKLGYSEVTLSSGNITPWGGGVTTNADNITEGKDWVDMATSNFEGGNGVYGDPFIIATAEQLACLSYGVESGANASGMYFKLSSDIDLTTLWGAKWTPIGSSNSTSYMFQGNFDGDGHTVTLGINDEDTDLYYSGLFGSAYGATISNLTIEGSVASVREFTGGLLAHGEDVTIENCVNNADVTNSYVGIGQGDAAGIVGRLKGIITLENCENRGNITSVYNAGGIVAIAIYTTAATLNNVSNSGNITVNAINENTTSYSGGILGAAVSSEITIINALNSGDIQSYSVGRTAYAGGIVGCRYYINDDCAVLIRNCSNIGSVEGDITSGGSAYAGGILGGNEYSGSTMSSIYNCYNTGEIKGNEIGAIMGGVSSYTIQAITMCYFSDDCGVSVATCSDTKTTDTKSYSTTYMKSADFVSELNVYVGDIIENGMATIYLLYWKVDYEDTNDGYPIFE